ncbi:MAG TPA: hypothetical protein VHC69_26820 [Polyangiaceae bacterium]|nr:hypothetical protein [Polyangiaceae bacterium]
MRLRNAARGMLASLLWVSVASAQATSTSGASAKAPGASASVGGSVAVPGASASAGANSAKAPGTAASAGATTQGATSAPVAGPATSAAPPTTSTPTSAAGGAAAATAAPIDGSTYAVRLRDLESRVDELKEQIRRSHTRLSLLSDTILSAGVGGARAEIRFQNDMSSAFRLTRALFVLDGAVQYNKADDTGALASQTEIPIFSGSIAPGDHTLQVLVQLRGHGYGVFSYLRGYKFEVKSSHAFTVTEGKAIDLQAIAWEKGGVTTPLEQRPAVRYVEKLRSGIGEGDTGAAPAESAPAAPAAAPAAGASGSISIGAGSK